VRGVDDQNPARRAVSRGLDTRSWSFRDWKGRFYPAGAKDELTYYASQFEAVEVDSTYYRNPSAKSAET
jgi:uncharacterized protein YecE (DUF72 family)